MTTRRGAARRAADAPSSSATSAPQRILGLDPGLDRTGYAVLDVAERRVVDAGLIRSATGVPLAERLCELAAGLRDVLADHTVDCIAIEELYSHYKHPRTAILMGHARGVFLLAAAERNISVLDISATKIKKTLTGNGHASKLQMQRAIMTTLGLRERPEPADVADAMAAAVVASVIMSDVARPIAGRR